MRRVLAVVSVAVAVISLVVACDRTGWVQTAPFAPSLRPAFGARVTDGQLRIWTGSPCVGISNLSLFFDPGNVEIELSSPQNDAGEVEYLTVGQPVPTMEISKALPEGFDWRSADAARISVYGGEGGWGSTTHIAEVIKGSADHPEDTYWFQDVGWLNPADVAAQNGKTFLTTCTPDPAKTPSLPPAFGARVTDGKLRIWTGSRCTHTSYIRLIFQPASQFLILKSPAFLGVDFEYFTLGDPSSGLEVIDPLPDGFDWRTQNSLSLVVYAKPADWDATTDLAEIIKGSADHPEDTYWFQGVGWLNPADVAAKDGKTFLATCTPEPAKK